MKDYFDKLSSGENKIYLKCNLFLNRIFQIILGQTSHVKCVARTIYIF